ncbi:MAG: hypothetical protein AAFO07_07580, partial [Bacteroidota bacterium]
MLLISNTNKCNGLPVTGKSVCTNYTFFTQLVFLFILLLSLLPFEKSWAQSTTPIPGTITINSLTSNNYSIPQGANTLTIELKGGDGGDVDFTGSSCNDIHGGSGATIKASFQVGDGPDRLKPGGLLRIFAGRTGADDAHACLGIGNYTGGGGGSSAVLYREPGSGNWELLAVAVAGGGGGANRPGVGTRLSGDGAKVIDQGGNVITNFIIEYSGGLRQGLNTVAGNGRCPEESTAASLGDGYAGGSTNCDRSSSLSGANMVSSINNITSDLNPGATGYTVKSISLALRSNGFASSTGGSGGKASGGNGFTGGGAGDSGGGGGGGSSGGAAVGRQAGGGGGSWISSSFQPSAIEKTAGRDGAGRGNNGFVTLTAIVVAPIAICKPFTVQLDASGNGSLTAADVDGGSTAPLGIKSLSIDQSSFNCSEVGDQTVAFTITDVNDVSSSCNASVTVEDNVRPIAVCQNVTVQLDANGNASTTANAVNNGSSDACGIFRLSLSKETFNCSDIGTQTLTMTATDNSGNSSSCNANVTVEDNVAPLAICYNDESLDATNTDNSQPNGIVTPHYQSFTALTTSDLSKLELLFGGFSTSSSSTYNFKLYSGEGTNGQLLFSKVRSITVRNNQKWVTIFSEIAFPITAGNKYTIELEYISGEYILWWFGNGTYDGGRSNRGNDVDYCFRTYVGVYNDIEVQLDNSGSASITPQQVDNGSSDACGIQSLALNKTTFTCSDIGSENSVTLTVTDNNDNTNTCNVSVSVEGNAAPTAICQNITTQLDANGSGFILPQLVNNGSNAACGIADLRLNTVFVNCSNLGPNTVTLTVEDNNGNTSTCTATVTVEDKVSPFALCQNVTVQLDANGNGSTTAAAVNNSSIDACGIGSLSLNKQTFDCSDVGTQTLTMTATDNSGNSSTCNASVRVEDDVAPVASCYNNETLDAAYTNGFVPNNVINSHNQSFTALTTSNLSKLEIFLTGSSGTRTINYKLYRGEGASKQLMFSENKDITLTGSPEWVALFSGKAFPVTAGNKYTIEILKLSGDRFGWIAGSSLYDGGSSENGNRLDYCFRTYVGVFKDIEVQLDNSGSASITPQHVDNGSNDACGIGSLSLNKQTFNCSDVGPQTLTLTVTDVNNNSRSCDASIVVTDETSPVATCQDITAQLDKDGDLTVLPEQIGGSSSDNCGVQSLSLDRQTFDCSDVGTQTLTLTITDVNNNSSTCTANLTVEDKVSPIASCQNVTVQLDANGNGSTTAAAVNNGSIDACGIGSLSLNKQTFDCSDVEQPQTVTLTVTDVNNNSSTCDATVVVTDEISPVAICRDLTAQLINDGDLIIHPEQIDAGSSDNCTIESLSLSKQGFECTDLGTQTVTLRATDKSENSSTCTANITVEDKINPIARCNDSRIILDETGYGSILPGAIGYNSSDVCGIQSFSLNKQVFDCSDVGTQTLTLTVTDNNGNSSTCTANLTVEDVSKPVAMCSSTESLDASNTGGSSYEVLTSPSSQSFTAETTGQLSKLEVRLINSSSVVGTYPIFIRLFNGESTTGQPIYSERKNFTVTNSSRWIALFAGQAFPVTAGNKYTIQIDVPSEAAFAWHIGSNTYSGGSADNGSSFDYSFRTYVSVAKNIEVQLDNTGAASITPQQVGNGSSDACGIERLSLDRQTFDCSDVGPQTLTLTVTDVNNNSSTCDATIVVTDEIVPVANCQDITAQLDNNNELTVLPEQIGAASSDNCGIERLSLNRQTFDCSDIGNQTLTLTVTDVNNNSSTCD